VWRYRVRAERKVARPTGAPNRHRSLRVLPKEIRRREHQGVPERPQELYRLDGRVQRGGFPVADQGQTQRQHNAGHGRPHHPHRLRVHVRVVPGRQPGLRTRHQADGRDGDDHGGQDGSTAFQVVLRPVRPGVPRRQVRGWSMRDGGVGQKRVVSDPTRKRSFLWCRSCWTRDCRVSGARRSNC
jgi:hypothetical protein